MAVRREWERVVREKEREGEELAVMVEARGRRDQEVAAHGLRGQLRDLKDRLGREEENHARLVGENGRLTQVVVQHKNRVVDLEGQVERLTEEKAALGQKMGLHLQELEGVRNSNSEWEEMLKGKLREAQREKQGIEE